MTGRFHHPREAFPATAARQEPDPATLGALQKISDATERRDILLLELQSLAFRMQCRVAHCEERDGADAVTGRGVGISYHFARDTARALYNAARYIEHGDAALAARPERAEGEKG